MKSFELRGSRFRRDIRGSMSTMFALSLTPVIFLIGVSVDYSRANRTGVMLQDAIDSATLGAFGPPATAHRVTASWTATTNFFRRV